MFNRIMKFVIGFFLIVSLVAYSFPEEAQTSEYQDRYIISAKVYDNVVPSRYEKIYKQVKRVDKTAAKAMVDAAREDCVLNTTPEGFFFGPNAPEPYQPFDCTSFPPKDYPKGAA